MFLGGINHATGNKPPTTLPAKGKYSPYDMRRAVEAFQTVKLTGPPFFPMVSLLPQRCMVVINDKYSAEIFETIYERLWIWVFNRHIDLAKPENMKAVLLDGGQLDEPQVDEILKMAGTKEIKGQLNENTRKAIEEYGAFGCPWLWVTKTDENGKEILSEPIFGSDRWTYLYRLLDIQFQDVILVPRGEASIEKSKL